MTLKEAFRVYEIVETELSVSRNGSSCSFSQWKHRGVNHLAGGGLMGLFKGNSYVKALKGPLGGSFGPPFESFLTCNAM